MNGMEEREVSQGEDELMDHNRPTKSLALPTKLRKFQPPTVFYPLPSHLLPTSTTDTPFCSTSSPVSRLSHWCLVSPSSRGRGAYRGGRGASSGRGGRGCNSPSTSIRGGRGMVASTGRGGGKVTETKDRSSRGGSVTRGGGRGGRICEGRGGGRSGRGRGRGRGRGVV
jgi:hypothetical protein